MKLSSKTIFILALVIELLIFLFCYHNHDTLGETFRYSARYSGRFSLLVFLVAFYKYSRFEDYNTSIKLFAFVHIIHFGFLATNIYLNEIPLEIHKLIGGALAYLMIVIAPFKLDKIVMKWQLVYFYYVSFVMIMTYVARVKGDFEGAEPFWFHYLALGIIMLCCFMFGRMIYKASRVTNT